MVTIECVARPPTPLRVMSATRRERTISAHGRSVSTSFAVPATLLQTMRCAPFSDTNTFGSICSEPLFLERFGKGSSLSNTEPA